MVVLFISTIIMGYVMYLISKAKEFTFSKEGKKENDDGVHAKEFWKSNKLYFIAPTVGNVIGIVILGLIYVMG